MYYSLYNNLGSANIELLDKYFSNLLLLTFLISLLLICCLISYLILFYDLEDAPVLICLNDWAEVNVKKQIPFADGIGNTVLIKMGLKNV